MLLPYLLPFLDAEIDRLQRARDLLAHVPADFSFCDPPTRLAIESAIDRALAAASSLQSAPAALPAAQAPPPVVVLRPYRPSGDRKPRRRQPAALDTALRSSVPAGPVAISAADVRRAQETKTAQSARPVAERSMALEWARPSTAARSVDALLQKLLDIGNSDQPAAQPKNPPLARA